MNLRLRITAIYSETKDTKSFELVSTNGEAINYKAGQFLPLIFKHINGEEVRRNYSLSSSPFVDSPLTITVKAVANGEFSRMLVNKAVIGDELEALEPAGFFVLPEKISTHQHFYFFAAGSGITPIFSLIKTLLHTTDNTQMVLVYSNSSKEQTIFYEALNHLTARYADRFRIIYFFSDAVDMARKRISTYSLGRLFDELAIKQEVGALFYLCGPTDYMQFISIYLRSYGIKDGHIRKEQFDVLVPEIKPEPEDKAAHLVTILLNKEVYQLKVQYPQTILQAAKESQIDLPFSCESGQCGTCAATCTSGNIFMWRNDMLMDEEIAKGRVLTCTGYPVEGDCEIEF
ncbi:MAG: ferredoxin--NADP reductase [Sediminibacterium sp.]|nr:ferredoxin--NADP reductase [Sediminibacterium sp.]